MTDAPLNRPLAPGRHARRPPPLALVYGVFLMAIGGMAVARAVLVSAPFSVAALSTTVSHGRALGRLWADANLPPRTWIPVANVWVARRNWSANWRRWWSAARFCTWRCGCLTGRSCISDDNGFRGWRAHASTAFTSAVGETRPPPPLAANVAAQAVGLPSTGPPRREYLPVISADGDVAAVAGLWRDATPILGRLEATRDDVLLVTAVGDLVQ